MRHFLFTLIACLATCLASVVIGCSNSENSSANSTTGSLMVTSDTILVSSHYQFGVFDSIDNPEYPPEYISIPLAEIKDKAFFNMLKGIIDTTYKRITGVLNVSLYLCDWEKVRRYEEYKAKENPSYLEALTVSLDILIPLYSANNLEKIEYILELDYTCPHEIHDIGQRVAIMLDGIPLILPANFDHELFEIKGRMVFKLSSGYIEYLENNFALSIPFPNDFFTIKNNKAERISKNSTIMEMYHM